MSNRDSQTQSKAMERIAFVLVIIFTLGLSYAIYITQQTVNDINQNHYSSSDLSSLEDGPVNDEE